MHHMAIQKHYSKHRTMPFFDILLRNRSSGSRSNFWTESLNCGTRFWSDLTASKVHFRGLPSFTRNLILFTILKNRCPGRTHSLENAGATGPSGDIALKGAAFSYQALTAFCRRHGLIEPPQQLAGRYEFPPGEEVQHDTSPHEVELAGKKRRVQTASAVLCYSRMLFFQIYPTFQRFDCKVFLTDALRYFGGGPARVMIDNTHVVVLRGTGREMVSVPEMEAFAERFDFRFVAHERGDANRSARVERPLSA
jgi:hypothetical protein